MNFSQTFFSWSRYRELIVELLTPREICESLEDINLNSLYLKGYRTLLLDVDNTLLTYAQKTVSLQRTNWVERAKDLGFHVLLISNNSSHRRIDRVANQLKVEGLYFACKPSVFAVRALARERHLNWRTCVFIGDQLFKDVVLANWLRAYSILVDPLDKRASLLKVLQRDLELYILRKLELR